MGIFGKKKEKKVKFEFKAVAPYDKEKPVKELFDLYMGIIDSTWNFIMDDYTMCYIKNTKELGPLKVVIYYTIQNNVISFKDELKIEILKGSYSLKEIKSEYKLSHEFKLSLYKKYVEIKNQENEQSRNNIESKISEFKKPFEKEFNRDNNINKIIE